MNDEDKGNIPNEAAQAAAAEAAAKAAAEAKPAAPVETTIEAPTVKVESTGDAAIDLTLNYFAKFGIAADHPAMKLGRDQGDFSVLEQTLAAKGAADAAAYVQIAKEARGRAVAEAESKGKATQDAIVKAVGTADDWKAVREWAAANATPEERVGVNAGLNGGPLQASITAAWLKGKYDKAMGGQKSALKPGAAGGTSGPAGGALDAKGFQAGVSALVAKHGPAKLEQRQEYKDLEARRKLGQRQGR